MSSSKHRKPCACAGVRLGETRANLHPLIQAARQRGSARLIMHRKKSVSSYYASPSKGDTAGAQPQHSELNIEVCGERKSQSRLAARGLALPPPCCAALSQVARWNLFTSLSRAATRTFHILPFFSWTAVPDSTCKFVGFFF